MTVVLDRGLEEHPKTDFSELDTDSDNNHTGNNRREKLSQLVNEPRNQDLASSREHHHPANNGESETRRGGHARRKINCRNDRRTKVPRTDSTKTKALQDCQKAHRDHGESHRIARCVMGEFCRASHKRHHYQIGANYCGMLKAKSQQLKRRRSFVERVDKVLGALSHAEDCK